MTSIISIYRRFPTKESCLEHLEKVRWKDEPCCPYCMSEKVSRKKEIEQRNRWQCSLCRKSFSVTVGTIFHNSHVGLREWFCLLVLKREKISSLAKELKIRRQTIAKMKSIIEKNRKDKFMTALNMELIPEAKRTDWRN